MGAPDLHLMELLKLLLYVSDEEERLHLKQLLDLQLLAEKGVLYLVIVSRVFCCKFLF